MFSRVSVDLAVVIYDSILTATQKEAPREGLAFGIFITNLCTQSGVRVDVRNLPLLRKNHWIGLLLSEVKLTTSRLLSSRPLPPLVVHRTSTVLMIALTITHLTLRGSYHSTLTVSISLVLKCRISIR